MDFLLEMTKWVCKIENNQFVSRFMTPVIYAVLFYRLRLLTRDIFICEFLLSRDVSCILGRERFIEPLWILISRIRIFRRVPMTLSRIDHLITTSPTSERLWEVTDTKWRNSSCNERKVLFSEQANYKAIVEELTGDRGWLCDKNNGKLGQGFLRMMTPINKLLSSNEWLLTIKGSLTNCNCRPFHSTTKPNEATT